MKNTRRQGRFIGCGCGSIIITLLLITIVLTIYLLAPIRSNILILGIDYTPPGSAVGRSDTIILATINPLEPYIGLLSIPRDLWVRIPGIGENRINTAHFFAEATTPGMGPLSTIDTISSNFGIPVNYYARIRFEAVREIVDAAGGVDIELEKPMAGYPPGLHHLTGRKALAFTRHRLGSDDFFRMEQGQLLLKEFTKQLLKPGNWIKIPSVVVAITKSVDTNIPLWLWPRIGFTIIRIGPENIDNRVISREMVTPFVTSQGANVLLPEWAKINPIINEMFGQ